MEYMHRKLITDELMYPLICKYRGSPKNIAIKVADIIEMINKRTPINLLVFFPDLSPEMLSPDFCNDSAKVLGLTKTKENTTVIIYKITI